MGPREQCASTERVDGWGRRIRTPATWSRATRPTTRRSPTSPRRPTTLPQGGRRHSRRVCRTTTTVGSADGGLQRAARAEAGHARRRDRDLPARARVATVARGALGDHERVEYRERDTTGAAERLDDTAHP